MVAVGLATILVGTVVMIFQHSTTIFNISHSRVTVFGNARAAIDTFARDLYSIVPIDSLQQRFVMVSKGESEGSDRTKTALDHIQFRATIPVNYDVSGQVTPDTVKTVHVLYSLRKDTDPELLLEEGQTLTKRTKRQIYVLQRRIYEISKLEQTNPAGVIKNVTEENGDEPQYADSEYKNERNDLCHYVLSLNFEYLHPDPDVDPNNEKANLMKIWKVPDPLKGSNKDPLAKYLVPEVDGNYGGGIGNLPITYENDFQWDPNNPNNEPEPPKDKRQLEKFPMAIRVSMRVVEGAGERQERLITRIIWLPLANP
jgi:hypothetical protein